MILDKMAKNDPETISHIIVPERNPERVPEKGRNVTSVYTEYFNDFQSKQWLISFFFFTGCIEIPYSTYQENRDQYIFRSMLTKPEVICVLSEVSSECRNVAAMSLLNIDSLKPLQLKEFAVLQTQVHTQVL